MTLFPTPLEEAAKAYRDVTFNALTLDECRDAATAAITAYLAQAEKEGWMMAPVEPTEAMIEAAVECGSLDDDPDIARNYVAMVAAASTETTHNVTS